jgi:hypothetical protein
LATETQVENGEFSASRFETVVSTRSRAIPLAVAGIVVLALVVRMVLAHRIVTPWIMIDELLYSELAKNFADGGEFLVRDAASPINNLAYPALISPAWLAEPVETAYTLAHAINVLVMVLAAVPVYLWGRRLMTPAYAALASVLVLLMPSLIYTGMLMTENAFFTAFVATSFAMALTLERPTLLRQGLLLVAVGITCLIRVQGLVLVPIYVAALTLKLLLDLRAQDGPRGTRYVVGELRRYIPSGAAFLLLGGGYIALKAVQGAPIEEGLAAYGGVVKVEYDLSNAFDWVLDHFAELTFSVAVVPVSALIVLLGLGLRGWTSTTAERAFVAVATSTFVLVVLQVGIYASRFSLRIEERNMFCLAPVLFLALALWLSRGLPRPAVVTAIAALVPAAALITLPLGRLLNIGILSDTFGLIPLYRLVSRPDVGVDTVKLLMVGGGAAAALAFAILPRSFARFALPSGVALFLALSSFAVFDSVRDHSLATKLLTGATDPSWIDDEIGPDAEAAALYGATNDLQGEAQILWQTEFWNRSVGTVYRLGPPEPTPIAERVASYDWSTGRITPEPAPTGPVRYAVAPTSMQLAGSLLASTQRLALYRVEQPMQVATYLEGVYADGWMVNDASFTQYATSADGPGRLAVRISRESWNGPSVPGPVTLRVGPLVSRDGAPAIGSVTSSRTWTVRSGVGRTFVLPTPKPPYRLEIHTGSTFSPSDFGRPDTRHLGAHVELSS